ncbi:MAG: HDOD domain-containing protein [Methylococcales bacterium]|jgi:HD-GYP domain-containing protein (c-di-GMP phosphodiesterase class II)|nr:HDOD domain-containing protein [Methylococcales bacterium]MBT7409563.1 HDOD domain-containing protein [Methylococcales bacterium]
MSYATIENIHEVRKGLHDIYSHVISDQLSSVKEETLVMAKLLQQACDDDLDAAMSTIFFKDDDYEYSVVHSVDSAIICEAVALHLNWDANQRLTLICASLTMNLAMIELQNKLFHQEGEVDGGVRQAIQQHPQQCVEILRRAGVDDDDWLNIVLQHHEQTDGQGYPNQFEKNDILLGSKVLYIADVYNAMVSPRGYRDGGMPDKVIREIFVNHKAKLDMSLAKPFLSVMGLYPPGCLVMLGSGETGLVTHRGEKPTQPKIVIIKDAHGGMVFSPSHQENYRIRHALALTNKYIEVDSALIWGEDEEVKIDFKAVESEPEDKPIEQDVVDEEESEPEFLLIPDNAVLETAYELMESIDLLNFSTEEIQLMGEIMTESPSIAKMTILINKLPSYKKPLIALGGVMDRPGSHLYDEDTVIKESLAEIHVIELCGIFLENFISQIEAKSQTNLNLTMVKEEALLVSHTMKVISSYVEDVRPVDAYLVGLFHNFGVAILSLQNSMYVAATDDAQNNKIHIIDFEKTFFKTTHTLFSYVIADQFNLSFALRSAIYHHHTLYCGGIDSSEIRILISMLKYSQHLVNHIALGKPDLFEWETNKEEAISELFLDEYTVKTIKDDVYDYSVDLES